MAFPEDVLSADEQVVRHLHPHWKALVAPALVVILSVAMVVAALVLLPSGEVGTIATYVVAGLGLLLVLRYGLWPFLVWRTTHYLFTNERVLVQHGVLARERRDIPLSRINDHSMSQSFLERLLGCGTLTIESAGERGQSVLVDVPDVQRMQTTLYELIEADHDRHSLGDEELRDILREARDEPPSAQPRASR